VDTVVMVDRLRWMRTNETRGVFRGLRPADHFAKAQVTRGVGGGLDAQRHSIRFTRTVNLAA